MMLTDLLAFAAEVCLYMSTVGFTLSLLVYSGNGGMILCAVLMLLAESCCALCRSWRGAARYLPALIMAPLFGMARSVPAVMLLAPVLLLILMRCRARRWKAEYYTVRNLFKVGCAVYPLFFMLFTVSSDFDRMVSGSLPLFVTWLFLTVLELRLLRNQYTMRLGASFKVMNAAVLLCVIFVSLLLSSGPVIAVTQKVMTFLWNRVAAPILIVLFYVFAALSSVLVALWSYLWTGEAEPMQMGSMVMGDIFGDLAPENITFFLWLARAVIALGILLFGILAWIVGGQLVNRFPAASGMSGPLKRERVSAMEKRPRSALRRTAAGGVRAIYRKYLVLCRPLSIPVDGTVASDVIRDRSAPYVGAENAKELRDLWLRARFSGADTDPEDTKRARKLLRQITRAAAKSKPEQTEKTGQIR